MPGDQHDPSRDGAALLAGKSPLDRYRRLQRRLRHRFKPFTRSVCPTCPTPCCRRPAAVTLLDVTLVEELGYQLPAGPEAASESVAVHLGLVPVPTLASEGEPCAFLASGGCSFLADSMPCGCVAFICTYMERWYSPAQLAELEGLIAALRDTYAALRAELLNEA